jgi:predicted 2-oxoglutarate/Fe(II)-dependent dioxygenase YbiX
MAHAAPPWSTRQLRYDPLHFGCALPSVMTVEKWLHYTDNETFEAGEMIGTMSDGSWLFRLKAHVTFRLRNVAQEGDEVGAGTLLAEVDVDDASLPASAQLVSLGPFSASQPPLSHG